MVCVLPVKVRSEKLLFLLLAYHRGPSQLIQTPVKLIYRGFGLSRLGPIPGLCMRAQTAKEYTP